MTVFWKKMKKVIRKQISLRSLSQTNGKMRAKNKQKKDANQINYKSNTLKWKI